EQEVRHEDLLLTGVGIQGNRQIGHLEVFPGHLNLVAKTCVRQTSACLVLAGRMRLVAVPKNCGWHIAAPNSSACISCRCHKDTGHFCRSCPSQDRKSTRLNSSHVAISYAVFCLKKKNRTTCTPRQRDR